MCKVCPNEFHTKTNCRIVYVQIEFVQLFFTGNMHGILNANIVSYNNRGLKAKKSLTTCISPCFKTMPTEGLVDKKWTNHFNVESKNYFVDVLKSLQRLCNPQVLFIFWLSCLLDLECVAISSRIWLQRKFTLDWMTLKGWHVLCNHYFHLYVRL